VVPDQPWASRVLDPGNDDADKAAFYNRVNANVVGEIIKNTLTPPAWDDLMLHSAKFTFVSPTGSKSYDGPCMMKVIYSEIEPTASVNIALHRQAIETTRMHDFKGNVVEMLKSIEKHHQAIVGNGQQYDKETYRRHLLTSLLSGQNSTFNNKIQAIKSDVESGNGYNSSISPGELITSSKQQYVNMERRGEWNKVDPKDAQIMALTTALKDAASAKGKVTAGANAKGSDTAMVPGYSNLLLWHTVFKGMTIEKDGATFTWCPHHKKAGLYDGLYYSTHTPATHADWKQGRNDWNAKRKGPKADEAAPVPSTAAKTLQVSDSIKTALMTNLCITEEDLTKILDSAGQEN